MEEFPCDVISDLSSEHDDGAVIYNLPLLKPDQQPQERHLYQLEVRTGDIPAADSNADVNINIVGVTGSTGNRSMKSLAKDPDEVFQLGQTDIFELETADIGEPRKLILSHSSPGEGAGWYPMGVTITETRDDVTSDFNFSCEKWLDDSVDDKLMQREFHLSGTRMYQSDIDVTKSKGIWNCYVKCRSEIMRKRKIDIKFTFCMSDDQSYESIHHVEEEHYEFTFTFMNHETSSESQFLKLRTEIEKVSAEAKKEWPIEEFYMVDADSGEKLRFVFDSALVWEGSARGHIRELPVVRPNQPFKPVCDYYVIFCTDIQSSRDFAPSTVYCKLRGKNGDTGWREIAATETSTGKFRPGRIDVFTVEAVHLGDVVDDVMIRMDGQGLWKLDRVKVKRGYYDEEEMMFDAYSREIAANEITELSLTRSIFVYPSKPLRKIAKTSSASRQNKETYNLCLTWDGLSALAQAWSSDDQDKVGQPKILNISLQLTGSKGSSDIEAINFSKALPKNNGKSETKSEVSVMLQSFGDLTKIGIGYLEPALPSGVASSQFVLRRVTVKSKETNQTFNFRPNYDFFFQSSGHNETGSNWIELVAARPRQDPKTVAKICNYVIKISTADHKDAGTRAHVYVILVGKNGDSGKRWLMTLSGGDDATHESGQTSQYTIEAAYLGELKQVVIGHDGRDVTSGWYLNDVIVTSSLFPDKPYKFTCNKWLANLQEDTFIERTLTLDHVIDNDQ